MGCDIFRRTDFAPILWVMIFVNASGALSYLFAVWRGGAIGLASVASFSIYIALFSSQVYIFVANLFTSSHYGKLVGIANLFGGLTSLISSFLYEELTMKQHAANPTPVMWGLFGAICFNFLFLLPMAFVAKRKRRQMKAQQVLKEANIKSASVISKRSALQDPSVGSRGQSGVPSLLPQYGFMPQPAAVQHAGRPKTPVPPPPQERSPSRDSEDRLSVSLPGIP